MYVNILVQTKQECTCIVHQGYNPDIKSLLSPKTVCTINSVPNSTNSNSTITLVSLGISSIMRLTPRNPDSTNYLLRKIQLIYTT